MSFLASMGAGAGGSAAASGASGAAASSAGGAAAGGAGAGSAIGSGALSSGVSSAGSAGAASAATNAANTAATDAAAAAPTFNLSGIAKDFGKSMAEQYAGGINNAIKSFKAGDNYNGVKSIFRQIAANDSPNPYTNMPQIASLSQMPPSYIPSGLDKYRRRY